MMAKDRAYSYSARRGSSLTVQEISCQSLQRHGMKVCIAK